VEQLVPLLMLAAAGLAMLASTLYHLSAYLLLPVDLLSFSESPFLNEIVKFRNGVPLYTPVEDNNSYPYTPGAPLLVGLIASAIGYGDSIPAFRVIQFTFVGLAALAAVGFMDALARVALSAEEYRLRPFWVAAWIPLMGLAVTEPRFNPYTHSLHNDGLALLVSMTAFWLAAAYVLAPRRWMLLCMALVPAAGFFVKQNQLSWAAVLVVFLVVVRRPSREWISLVAGCLAAAAIVVVGSYLVWGEPYRYWIFDALGDKRVSPARSLRHLLQAGVYAALGLASGWILARRDAVRRVGPLWLCWGLVFGLAAYTSGIGFQVNHLGPAVVAAVGFALVALVRVWPVVPENRTLTCVSGVAAVCAVVLSFGGLGMIREPRNPVPEDFGRYVGQIQDETRGANLERVLIDTGTWPYFQQSIVMRDRSAPVSLHVGINQTAINHTALADTIARIDAQYYDKILARQIDTPETWYDFQNRGSGVKAAILRQYRIVRRIAGVKGVEYWWPMHLVSEVAVLEPRRVVGHQVTGRDGAAIEAAAR
jgi:hypothetical protein